jgi:hypothetical protein
MVMAQEYVRWDATTWPSREAARQYMLKENRVAERCHRALTEGDAEWGTSSTLGRNAAMDDLMLRQRCSDLSQWACLPLDSQYALFIALVDQLAATPLSNVTFASPLLAQITAMQNGAFAALLQTAHAMLVSEADPILEVTRARMDTLLGVAAATFILAAVVLRAALVEVRRGIERVRRMLFMLPPGVIAALPTVDAYLKRGHLPTLHAAGGGGAVTVGVAP